MDVLDTAHGKPVHLVIEPDRRRAQHALRESATEAAKRGDLVRVCLGRMRVETVDQVTDFESAYNLAWRIRGRRIASWSVSEDARLTGSDIHSLMIARRP